MSLQGPKQLPISLKGAAKREVRSQFAALCFRVRAGKPQVLLITSRRSGRWIIPKGWPMHAKTPGEAALQEAWEEAGVIGKSYSQNLGLFSYNKIVNSKETLPCVALVYPVKVKTLKNEFPEKGQRRRKWFSLKKASRKVTEPELQAIIRSFDPRLLKR